VQRAVLAPEAILAHAAATGSNRVDEIANDKPRSYKQGARARARQRTREALLDVATEEFYAGRWTSTSLQVLAKRANVTKQTLLRHFGSKEELFLQAMMRSGRQVLNERWSAPSGDIDGVIDNLLAHYEVWGERARNIGSWQSGPDSLAGISQAGRQLHYDWVDFAFAPQLKGSRGKARVRRRAALIVICDVQTWWILAHDLELSRREVHAILADLVKRLIAEQE
jgi:AcrR family transcriptional regulator